MATKLTLKPSHQLTINPVIQTFIGFLPMSRIEFINKIKNEVESNPMLDTEAPETTEAKRETTDSDLNFIEKKLEKADSSFLSSYEEQGFFRKYYDKESIDKNRAIELFTPSTISLSNHLIEQAMSQFNEKELEIAEYIIYNLNKDGYLDVEVESIASTLNTTPAETERIRKIISTFDPPGVASKTLKECLLAQLKQTDENKMLRILITEHLEDLSKSKYEMILKSLKIDKDELFDLITRLKRLDPKPGNSFEGEDIEYAEVDLLLIKENDEYKIKFIDEGIPNLMLSQYYEQMLEKTPDKKTKSYLKQKHKNAQLFIEGLDLRKSIIVKIAEILIRKQKDFLDFGEKWKKPLTMKEIARELNYNESTISRAVNNKFIASEKGIISLRSFFSYGISGKFGFKHSVETVKDKIKKIIDDEPKKNPISDQDIAAKLSNLGIQISRRTIRNYRDELNIPNSSKRKEKYKLNSINGSSK